MSKYLQCMVNCSQNGFNVTGRTEDDLPRGPRMGWFFMVKFQKWLGKSAHEWSQTGWFSYNGQDECGWDRKVDPSFVDSCWFRWKVTPMVVGLYHIMFLLPSISGSSEFILHYLWSMIIFMNPFEIRYTLDNQYNQHNPSCIISRPHGNRHCQETAWNPDFLGPANSRHSPNFDCQSRAVPWWPSET